MKFLTILMALLITWPSMAQRSKGKTDVLPAPVTTQGISYFLPHTGIRVKVSASQTTFVPGPYAVWAEQLLGIRGVRMQPRTLWNIEEVTFDTFAEPDPDHMYKTNSLDGSLVQLTPEGCLAGINSNLSPEKAEPPISNSFIQKNKPDGLTFTNLTDNPNLSGRSPLDQRAVEAASRILKARSTRFDIAAGLLDEFHPDGKAYRESFSELRKIEEENLELFTGKSTVESFIFSYDYFPPSMTVQGEVIFRFDEDHGFLPKTDFSGKPVMIDVWKNEFPAGIDEAQNQGISTGTLQAGIFFRQPGMADIKVTKELEVIATTRIPLAQFGFVAPVPPELINGSYCIEFHPLTGSLKTVIKK